MIKEQELKEQCTPEFIKWMCEYAEGFGYIDYVLSQSSDLEQARFNNIIFPLLLHRAVEGWNKSQKLHREIVIYKDKVCEEDYKLETHNGYEDYYKYTYMNNYFKNYQPCHITACEMAIWDCLLNIFKQEERDENI